MMAAQCILPTHPRTGLRALGFTSRGPIWPVMGGDESEDAAAQAAAAAKAAAEWTPPKDQEDLDRILGKAVARAHAQYPDYEALKEKAGQFDALSAASQTDTEKAVEAAKAETEAKARGEAIPRVVRAEFKAAAKGVLTPEQLAALLEDLDLTKYVDKDGEVDEEKVTKKVAAFAPAVEGKQPPRPLSLGQGTRPAVAAKPGDGARAALARRGIKLD